MASVTFNPLDYGGRRIRTVRVIDGNGRAIPRQPFGDGASDTTRRARDQGNFVGEHKWLGCIHGMPLICRTREWKCRVSRGLWRPNDR